MEIPFQANCRSVRRQSPGVFVRRQMLARCWREVNAILGRTATSRPAFSRLPQWLPPGPADRGSRCGCPGWPKCPGRYRPRGTTRCAALQRALTTHGSPPLPRRAGHGRLSPSGNWWERYAWHGGAAWYEAWRSLSPNPPKDTDGRREESGRGGEGATGEIAWVPFGVGRSADGLHRRTGAPMAVCGSCDARDGERIRSRELSRTGLARVCGDLRLSGGWVADGAVRPGVEWLAAGPRRG